MRFRFVSPPPQRFATASFLFAALMIFSNSISAEEALRAKTTRDKFSFIEPAKETTMDYKEVGSQHAKVSKEDVPLVETTCNDEKTKVKLSGEGKGCAPFKMRKSMAKHMDMYFLACVKKSAEQAGLLGGVESVEVKSSGCFEDRTTKTGNVSNHSKGRACDISQFTLKPSGDVMAGKMPGSEKGKNKIFYDSFRDCWQQSIFVSSNWACQGKSGESGSGSIGGTGHEPPPAMDDHCDHIHLSFPECAESGGKS